MARNLLLRVGVVMTVLGLLAVCTATPRAQAAAIVVNSTADNVATDGRCTLREALANANDNAATYPDCAAGNGADTLSFAITGTITLGSALPQVADGVTISGPGAGLLAISGNDVVRVLSIGSGVTAHVSGLTIRDGSVTGIGVHGGGIHNSGTLTVDNCILLNNTSGSDGGGIFNDGGVLTVNSCAFITNDAFGGGGIYNYLGMLVVSNSTFSGNVVGGSGAGGGIGNVGTGVVSNSTFFNNLSGGNGGGIFNDGALTVSYSSFDSNSAVDGGGIDNIWSSSTLTATGLLLSGNRATRWGAALHSDEGIGDISASCFVNNADLAGALDVQRTTGTLIADGNWWNVPTGPNTGGETTNVSVSSFLSSRPACGASATSDTVTELCIDDRLNCRFGDDYAIVYNAHDDHGHPALHTYCVDAAGHGVLGMIVTPHDLEGIASKPHANTQVKKGNTGLCRTPVSFWVLTTGEYQVNIGPDYKGDLIRMIFDGLPPQGKYFKKCNVLKTFGLCSQ